MNRKELEKIFEKNMEIKYDESAEKYPSLIKACKNVLDEYRISDFLKVYQVLNLIDECTIELEQMDEKIMLMYLMTYYDLNYLICREFFNLNIPQRYKVIEDNINYCELMDYISDSPYIKEQRLENEGIYRFNKKIVIDMFFLQYSRLEGTEIGNKINENIIYRFFRDSRLEGLINPYLPWDIQD